MNYQPKQDHMEKLLALIAAGILGYFVLEAFFTPEMLTSKPDYKIKIGSGTPYAPKN